MISPTKFVVPTIPNATVSRPALVARLDETACPLSLVTGPAGSGKTSLLVEWAHGLEPGGVAWLSCDSADADPDRFWRALVTVVRDTWPDCGVEAAEMLEGGERRELAIALADDLGAVGAPTVVIIDDFHLARPDPECFGALVQALRAPTRLVLGSRVDPAFPLARLRVNGLVCDLRERDLKLDLDDTAAALDALGAKVDPDSIAQIHRLTEGWAAGVQLVGLAVGDTAHPSTLIEALAATDQLLTDFLINEVIEHQSEAMVEFLLCTSVLAWFDVELAAAVTGRVDAGNLLEQARRSRLFVVELDLARGRYRYHHLFGQFLQARLRAQSPRREKEVLVAAAEASRERGELVDAVTYLMRAGDVVGAIGLLKVATMTAVTLPEGTAVADATRALLREVAASDVRGSAGVIVDALILLDIRGASAVTPPWLNRLEAVADDLAEPTRADLQLAWAAHHTQLGDPEQSLAHLRRREEIHQRTSTRSEWDLLAVIGNVYNRLWLEDLQGARAAVEAAAVDPGAHRPAESAMLDGFQALVDYLEGDISTADARALASLRAADELGLAENHTARIEALTVAGLCAAEHGDPAAGATYFERALRSIDTTRTGLNDPLLRTMHLRLSLVRGDDPNAWSWLEQSRSLMLPETSHVVRQHFDRAEARLLIEQGDLTAAERVLERLQPAVEVTLLEARLAIGRHDLACAARQVDKVDDPETCPRTRVVAGLLRALASGTDGAAVDELERLLPLAARAGFHRTVVDFGPRMWELLRRVKSADQADYVGELLAAADRHLDARPDPHPRDAERDRTLIDPLTDRERAILHYLTSRLTMAELAAELYVSVNTVKSHVRATYRKLGVASRSEAVTRARTLGLL